MHPFLEKDIEILQRNFLLFSVFKRSANDGVYGLFAGKNILELDILNLPDFINNNNANDNKKN